LDINTQNLTNNLTYETQKVHNKKSKPKINLRSTNLYNDTPINFNEDVYLQERKEAINAFRKRNKLYKKACRAYEEGDHTMAKKYALEGHHYNSLFQSLNDEACERIFNARQVGNYKIIGTRYFTSVYV